MYLCTQNDDDDDDIDLLQMDARLPSCAMKTLVCISLVLNKGAFFLFISLHCSCCQEIQVIDGIKIQ